MHTFDTHFMISQDPEYCDNPSEFYLIKILFLILCFSFRREEQQDVAGWKCEAELQESQAKGRERISSQLGHAAQGPESHGEISSSEALH